MFISEITRFIKREVQLDLDTDQRTLFYLIPRHPQRFEAAFEMLQAEKDLRVCRRSELMALGDSSASAIALCRGSDVVLGDSLGELPWYYAQAQVAIVAGSFAPLGGQNFIEACALGVPVVVGPYTRNFEQAVADALREEAVYRASNAAGALRFATELLDDRARQQRMGDAGLHWVQKHAGSVERVVLGINEVLS